MHSGFMQYSRIFTRYVFSMGDDRLPVAPIGEI
jgi:hypothetical protein